MEFPMELVLRIQQEFAGLYWKTGLIAVNPDYIHVRPECLARISDKEEWKLERYKGRLHADIWIRGVRFTTCMTLEEAEAIGLPW